MSHIKAKMTTSLITAMNKLEAVELVRCTKCPGSSECAGRYVLNFLILVFKFFRWDRICYRFGQSRRARSSACSRTCVSLPTSLHEMVTELSVKISPTQSHFHSKDSLEILKTH